MTFSPPGCCGEGNCRCGTTLGFDAWCAFITDPVNVDNRGKLHDSAPLAVKYKAGTATDAEIAQLRLNYARARERSEGPSLNKRFKLFRGGY